MREIKFKGKTINRDKWVYGSLICDEGRYWIVIELYYSETPYGYADAGSETIDNYQEEVIPETVGQFTGLKDKNGKDIYEWDIVRNINRIDELRKIRFCNLSARFEFVTIKQYGENVLHGEIEGLNINNSEWCEIIGNIYENPELIKQQ